MPKVSKIKSKRRIEADVTEVTNTQVYTCAKCGTQYNAKRNNFPKINSMLYKGNEYYATICRKCVDDIYEYYASSMSEQDAAERVCQKLDIYWSESIFDKLYKKSGEKIRMSSYIKETRVDQYINRTYDDTIKENKPNNEHTIVIPKTDDSIIDFWGKGLSDEHYEELENRLRNWKGDREISDFDMGELTVIKQICMLEVQINLDAAAGRSIDKNVKALDSLLGSGNLRPVQKKTDEAGTKEDKTPFGVWINRIENDEPIPEPDEEFKDVDGIVKYVSTWFLGHMCKMLKVNNRFSNLYEEELAKLTVERPEYEGDDDEDIVEDIFERANKAAEIASKMSEGDEYDEL